VGPFYNDKYRDKAHRQLRSAVRGALAAAAEAGAVSVAVPAISTGAYRFPLDDAARVHVEEALGALERGEAPPVVRFVLFAPRIFDAFTRALDEAYQAPSGPP
jgi:O-acetyl-ADP-ribose deacetylase (regulator of RNase III)